MLERRHRLFLPPRCARREDPGTRFWCWEGYDRAWNRRGGTKAEVGDNICLRPRRLVAAVLAAAAEEERDVS